MLYSGGLYFPAGGRRMVDARSQLIIYEKTRPAHLRGLHASSVVSFLLEAGASVLFRQQTMLHYTAMPAPSACMVAL
jgi:hypothetical protein